MNRAIRCTLLVLLVLATALPARAAVFTVSKTADTLDGACDSDCSVREAVSAANAGADPDVVVVPAGFYFLTRAGAGEDSNATGDLDVNQPLILVGAGPGSTVFDGAGLDRVLDVRAAAEVFGVTVRNGRAAGGGGGILVRGLGVPQTVLVHRSVVSGNQARRQAGTGGNGGGIAVEGVLEIRESAVLDNLAEADGGGISAGRQGIFFLANVTVSGNRAAGSGGGLEYEEDNGVVVSGSTVAFNQAGVAGGGIFARSALFPGTFTAQILGSIVAANTAPLHPDCEGAASLGHSVIGVREGCSIDSSDKRGTLDQPLDAKLAPLSGAFGPTPVHALLDGSPALEHVPASSCEAVDQMGQDRSGRCEAGAWERASNPVCIPGGSVLCLQEGRFRVTATWRSGAIAQDAHASPLTDDTGNYWFFSPENLELMVKVLDGCAVTGHWWVFASGLTDRGVTLRAEDLATGRTWAYTTPPGKTYPPKLDTGAFDCDASAASSRIRVETAAEVAPGAPAAVLVVTRTEDTFDGACDSHCSLREAVAAANAAAGMNVIVAGPGLYTLGLAGRGESSAATGDLDVVGDLLILGAGADRTVLDGGGIDRVLDVRSGSLEIHDVTVRNGRALTGPTDSSGSGGGIWASIHSVTLVRSAVTGNQASGYGGGIFADELTARDSTISGNVAGEWGGGAIAVDMELSNVTVSGNQAGGQGGGLFTSSGVIEHATVSGNSAVLGGGIATEPEACVLPCPPIPLTVNLSTFAGNTGGTGPDCFNLALDDESGHNVFGVANGCDPGPSDLAGTLAQPLDPRLGPLGLHGGPTPTRVPLEGSPLLNRALCPAGRDQRGRLRPDLTLCDAGAVEIHPGACQPNGDTLCLGAKDRFEVTVEWTAKGQTGSGKAFPLEEDTGAFWFFDPANLELTVKVLNGCGTNGRYWVFLSGLTDVGVEVTVRDMKTGKTWSHTHAAGKPFQPRLDTNALEVCP